MCMDVTYFYLSTESMIRYGYIRFELKKITDDFRIQYNLNQYAHNGYFYEEIRKGMCGLPQEGIITHNKLVEVL